MKIPANTLRLVNIGQLIEVVTMGSTLMGKLERVKLHPYGHSKLNNFEAEVTLRISGDTIVVPATHTVNIKRSGELHELHLASLAVEDLVDAGVGV